MGAAVIGGVAAGVFKDFDVIHRFISVEHTAIPDPAARDKYRQLRGVLESAYHGLEGTYAAMAKL